MHQYAATILENSSRALAGYAAAELLEHRPETAADHDNGAHRAWQDFFQARIDELASALLVQEPKLFAADVAWTRALFHVRSVPLEHLRVAFDVLQTVVQREVPEKVRTPLPSYFDLARKELESEDVHLPERLKSDDSVSRLAALFLKTVLEGERARASSLVLDAVRGGLPIQDVYMRVLVPVAQEVGRMWHAGEINVAEEHFATATTELVISQLYEHLPRQQRHGKTVIVTAAQGNQHDLAVRLIADYFEMAGWRVIHLGGDMPPGDLALAVDDFDADLVALSIAMSRHIRATHEAIKAIRASGRGKSVKILIGGLALRRGGDVWKQIGADGWARSANEAVEVAAELVGLPPPQERASAS